MDEEERKKMFSELGLEPRIVETSETPIESNGVAVIENEEIDKGRREEELEQYRENAGF